MKIAKDIISFLIFLLAFRGLFAILIGDSLEAGHESRQEADMKSIQTALDLYKSDNGFYPTNIQGLKALIAKPHVSPLPKNYRSYGYLEKVPKDNWGNVFLYQYFGPPGNGVIIIRSRGKDGSIGGYGENRDQLLIYEDT